MEKKNAKFQVHFEYNNMKLYMWTKTRREYMKKDKNYVKGVGIMSDLVSLFYKFREIGSR